MHTFAIFRRIPNATGPRWQKVCHRRAVSRPAALRAFGIPALGQHSVLVTQDRLSSSIVHKGTGWEYAEQGVVPGLYMAERADCVTFDYIDAQGRPIILPRVADDVTILAEETEAMREALASNHDAGVPPYLR